MIKRFGLISAISILLLTTICANALTLSSKSLDKNPLIPKKFAYCIDNEAGQLVLSKDISPALSWSGVPKGTQSFAITMTDENAPKYGATVDSGNAVLNEKSARTTFYHWVLIDIPNNITGIKEGADSNKANPKGKKPGKRAYGIDGLNDFSKYSSNQFGGYDGPCPPWDDPKTHHYTITIYALNVEKLPIAKPFNGEEVLSAMDGHIIAKASIKKVFTNNPKVLKKLEAKE